MKDNNETQNNEKQDQNNRDDKFRKGRRESNIEKFFASLNTKAPLPELLSKQLDGLIPCKIDKYESDYAVDLRSGKFEVLKPSDLAEDVKFDCTIRLNRYDIEELIVGDLNPQIAMLSHKIKIEGSMNMAMYFFNLFE